MPKIAVASIFLFFLFFQTAPLQAQTPSTSPQASPRSSPTALAKNPFMKLFVASGYYDMATPYFAAEHTLATMNLDPQLKRNVTTAYYEAGHMMYIKKNRSKS